MAGPTLVCPTGNDTSSRRPQPPPPPVQPQRFALLPGRSFRWRCLENYNEHLAALHRCLRLKSKTEHQSPASAAFPGVWSAAALGEPRSGPLTAGYDGSPGLLWRETVTTLLPQRVASVLIDVHHYQAPGFSLLPGDSPGAPGYTDTACTSLCTPDLQVFAFSLLSQCITKQRLLPMEDCLFFLVLFLLFLWRRGLYQGPWTTGGNTHTVQAVVGQV